MSVLTNYIKHVSEAEDPKREILKWVKGIEKEYVLGDRVIVATYARPAKTSGGKADLSIAILYKAFAIAE